MEATVIISPSGLPSECYRDTELRMCSAVVAECLTVAFTVCSFPVAAVTNYHKRGTLKEQKSGLSKFIISSLGLTPSNPSLASSSF